MAKDSDIEWTHHTFNPWWGCVKLSPACAHCYAETWARRFGDELWGGDAPRRFFREHRWREPLRWNSEAEKQGIRRQIRCFFSEIDLEAFKQLQAAVAPFHKPETAFEIETYCGKFENAVPQIKKAIGNSFALIFVDPTGWTGFAFENIKEIFRSRMCEVLINFMYDHVNRFVASRDSATIASLNPILGGPGWRDRLDTSLPRGLSVEKLFRDTLQRAGNFAYVISTKIEKNATDRPRHSHSIVAGTFKYLK